MKITLIIGDDTTKEGQAKRITAALPYKNCDHVIIDEPCPSCEHAAPTKLRGRGYYHSHDTHHATAVALCCGVAVGKLEVKVSTIFGIAEDQEMLSGKYGSVY